MEVCEVEPTSGFELASQISVGGMLDEAAAQFLDRKLDSTTEFPECSCSSLDCIGSPALKPAVLGTGFGAERLETGLMTEKVEGNEVAEGLRVEHRLKIELKVCLADKTG